VPGRRTRGQIDYQIGFDGNPHRDELNGFTQRFHAGLTTKLSRRSTLSFSATAQSVLVSNFLFQPSGSLSNAESAETVGDLSNSVSSTPGTGGLGQSPAVLAFLGGMRRSATVEAGYSYSQSKRLTWTWSALASRDLPSPGSNYSNAMVFSYPAVTWGITNGRAAYNLRPRTEIDAELEYVRTHSAYSDLWIGSAGMSIYQQLGRKWFVKGSGGYSLTGELAHVNNPTGPSYLAEAGIGAKTLSQLFLFSAKRDVDVEFGLGRSARVFTEGIWTWARPNATWAVDQSVGYERFLGKSAIGLSGWLVQSRIRKRLSDQVAAVASFAYASDSSYFTESSTGLTQMGVRVSLVLTPRAVTSIRDSSDLFRQSLLQQKINNN
jgi:hypothetical protein